MASFTGETDSTAIDDAITSATTTWSSNKIAQQGGGTGIDDNTISQSSVWSSDKTNSELVTKAEIDDTNQTTNTTWSSDRIDTAIGANTDINDTQQSVDSTWSSSKISGLLETQDVEISNESFTSRTETSYGQVRMIGIVPRHPTAVHSIATKRSSGSVKVGIAEVETDGTVQSILVESPWMDNGTFPTHQTGGFTMSSGKLYGLLAVGNDVGGEITTSIDWNPTAYMNAYDFFAYYPDPPSSNLKWFGDPLSDTSSSLSEFIGTSMTESTVFPPIIVMDTTVYYWLNDTQPDADSTWSSSKISSELSNFADLDDSKVTTSNIWSSDKITNYVTNYTTDTNKIDTGSHSSTWTVEDDIVAETSFLMNDTVFFKFNWPSKIVHFKGNDIQFNNDLLITDHYVKDGGTYQHMIASGGYSSSWDINDQGSVTLDVDDGSTTQSIIEYSWIDNTMNIPTRLTIADELVALIDDSKASNSATWSSYEIDKQLTNQKGAKINDNVTSSDTSWSSSKVDAEIGYLIDDGSSSLDKVWSSTKTEDQVESIVNDSATNLNNTWSSNKIDSTIASSKAPLAYGRLDMKLGATRWYGKYEIVGDAVWAPVDFTHKYIQLDFTSTLNWEPIVIVTPETGSAQYCTTNVQKDYVRIYVFDSDGNRITDANSARVMMSVLIIDVGSLL